MLFVPALIDSILTEHSTELIMTEQTYEHDFFSLFHYYRTVCANIIEENIVHTSKRLIKFFAELKGLSNVHSSNLQGGNKSLRVVGIDNSRNTKSSSRHRIVENLAIMLTEKRAMSNYINQADYLLCASKMSSNSIFRGPYSVVDNMHAFAI